MKEQPLKSSLNEEERGSFLVIDGLCFLENGPYYFAAKRGSCIGLSGRSGIGKSQLLKSIVDLIPHKGEIYLDGLACSEIAAPDWRRQVALIPAESFWWYDTVREHFSDMEQRFLHCGWLEDLGFDSSVMSWQISRLSTGERQRLALIRALVNEPGVLLLDEPTSGLDPLYTKRYEGILAQYCRQNDAPLVWVTHDRKQLFRVSDRVFLVEKEGLQQLEAPSGNIMPAEEAKELL